MKTKTKAVSKGNANGIGPGKHGAKPLPAFINMHFLDKPIVQVKLGSNKTNKTSKVGK